MIHYVTGDATQPIGTGDKIIAHICNDMGGWGRGFVLALSNRWPEPEKMYRWWHRDNTTVFPFGLGHVQYVPVSADITVANMVAQHDIETVDGIPPIRYEAVGRCLEHLCKYTLTHNKSIHMPRIGCGLAGGSWDMIEALIEKHLSKNEVYVYDLPTTTKGF